MGSDLSCSQMNTCPSGCPQAGAHCGKCCGGACSQPAELSLTETELALLSDFARLAFLPVACAGESRPVYLGEDSAGRSPCPDDTRADRSRALLALQSKGLISIDYDLPLQGFDYTGYEQWPVHGSMALTELGQVVLDSLYLQQIQGEDYSDEPVGLSTISFHTW